MFSRQMRDEQDSRYLPSSKLAHDVAVPSIACWNVVLLLLLALSQMLCNQQP